MYPWLQELLCRWRKEGRRPPSSAGREFLALSPAALHDLIGMELERTRDRDVARISLKTAGWSFAGVLAAGAGLALAGVSWENALFCIFPAMAIIIALLPLLQWALVQDTRRLATLVEILPEFEDPAYVGALLALLPYHPSDWYRPLKSTPNPQVEEPLLKLLARVEPRHVEYWDGRDWNNLRALLRTRYGKARLALEATHAAGRLCSGELLSALRALAVSQQEVFSILGVNDPEARHIRDAARIYVRQIEAKIAGERQAATLLRASHVRETSLDEELVRPVPLHEATPVQQLLRTAQSQVNAETDLLRIPPA